MNFLWLCTNVEATLVIIMLWPLGWAQKLATSSAQWLPTIHMPPQRGHPSYSTSQVGPPLSIPLLPKGLFIQTTAFHMCIQVQFIISASPWLFMIPCWMDNDWMDLILSTGIQDLFRTFCSLVRARIVYASFRLFDDIDCDICDVGVFLSLKCSR